MKRAIYPGSFDPVTLGHMDVIRRACNIFDEVIVTVPINPAKNAAFSTEERMKLLEKACEGLPVTIDSTKGLLADYAAEKGVNTLIKGLRAMSDFEYEFQMALTNKKLNPQLETVFIPTSSEFMFLSSSMVKQIASFGGDISHFVPEKLLEIIKSRLQPKA